MGQGLRRASWSEGRGCGGAASFSFGEGPDSDASPIASAIRLRYSPPLFVATTRRLPPPAACHHSPPAITRRPLPPPPLLATPVAVCLPAACRFSPPVITRRLPPATSAAVCVPASACRPAASHQPHPLPASFLLPLPVIIRCCLHPRRYRPPPASFLLPLPVIIRCCLHSRRFSPVATARRNSCLPPPLLSAICHHPLPAISAAMRRPGGQMGCGGTPRGRSGRDASPARSSAK